MNHTKVLRVCSHIPGLADCVKSLITSRQVPVTVEELPIPRLQDCKPAISAARPTEEERVFMEEAEMLVTEANVLAPMIHQLPRLRWAQLTSAGVERMFDQVQAAPPKFRVTRFASDQFGLEIAEYVVSRIISRERCASRSCADQKRHLWNQADPVYCYRPLARLNIGVMGFGQMGKQVVRACKAFNATTWTLTRTPVSERPDYVDECRLVSELPSFLAGVDYVINTLPSTPLTRHLLTAELLRHCKPGTVFVNVGRGDIVSTADLLTSLREGYIGGAILDVFEEEPLPSTSPLWDMEQVSITPHIANQSTADQMAETVVNNLERFLNGQPLNYELDWSSCY